jgi:tryptophanyl-tRNA synthetase
LGIFSAITGKSMKETEAHFAGSGYGTLKTELAEAVIEHLRPIREKTMDLVSDATELDRLLAIGAQKANEIAESTLAKVYDRIGFVKGL